MVLFLHGSHVIPKDCILSPCKQIQHVVLGEVDRTLQEVLFIEFFRFVHLISYHCRAVYLFVLKDVEVRVTVYATRFQEMSPVDEGKPLCVALLIMRDLYHLFLLILLHFLLKRRIGHIVDGITVVDGPDHH